MERRTLIGIFAVTSITCLILSLAMLVPTGRQDVKVKADVYYSTIGGWSIESVAYKNTSATLIPPPFSIQDWLWQQVSPKTGQIVVIGTMDDQISSADLGEFEAWTFGQHKDAVLTFSNLEAGTHILTINVYEGETIKATKTVGVVI